MGVRGYTGKFSPSSGAELTPSLLVGNAEDRIVAVLFVRQFADCSNSRPTRPSLFFLSLFLSSSYNGRVSERPPARFTLDSLLFARARVNFHARCAIQNFRLTYKFRARKLRLTNAKMLTNTSKIPR